MVGSRYGVQRLWWEVDKFEQWSCWEADWLNSGYGGKQIRGNNGYSGKQICLNSGYGGKQIW
jgi:hypothetical protein